MHYFALRILCLIAALFFVSGYVLGVNFPPTISPIPDQSGPVGLLIGLFSFTVGDVDDAPSSLVIFGLSSNEALISIFDMFLGGLGADCSVLLVPLPNQTGETTISLF